MDSLYKKMIAYRKTRRGIDRGRGGRLRGSWENERQSYRAGRRERDNGGRGTIG